MGEPVFEPIRGAYVHLLEVLGYQPDHVVVDLVQRAKGFIFAAREEFGIAGVEAQAAGTPVIAFGAGGSLETIRGIFPGERPRAGTTGVFFREQTPASLIEALNWFEGCRQEIEPQACRDNAARFDRPRFYEEFRQFVKGKWEQFQSGGI